MKAILFVSFLPFCWLAMQTVHEAGHVFGAVCSRGRVQQIVIHPLTISRTVVSPNPHPMVVVWSGPLAGALVPACLAMTTFVWRFTGFYLLRFFAGFCLIANGGYIAFGSIGLVGDAGEMIRLGSPSWLLWLCGLPAMAAGLALWHGLGEHFGIGPRAKKIEPAAVWISVIALVTVLAVGLWVSDY